MSSEALWQGLCLHYAHFTQLGVYQSLLHTLYCHSRRRKTCFLPSHFKNSLHCPKLGFVGCPNSLEAWFLKGDILACGPRLWLGVSGVGSRNLLTGRIRWCIHKLFADLLVLGLRPIHTPHSHPGLVAEEMYTSTQLCESTWTSVLSPSRCTMSSASLKSRIKRITTQRGHTDLKRRCIVAKVCFLGCCRTIAL